MEKKNFNAMTTDQQIRYIKHEIEHARCRAAQLSLNLSALVSRVESMNIKLQELTPASNGPQQKDLDLS